MKLKVMMTGIALAALTSGAMAAEPTRGFLFEHGKTAESRSASLDFTNNVAGARMGVAGHELIVNSSAVGSGTSSDAIFKFGIPDVSGLALYVGMAYADEDADPTQDRGASDYFNFKIGAAYTAEMDSIQLSVTPEFVVDDVRSDEYFNLGLGAHFGLGEMSYGTLKLGAEVWATTLDDVDPVLALGVRWGFNDRIVVDLIPVTLGDADTLGVPGQVRINAVF